ncbi:hypothetical protein POVWA2_020060 [Plasmodium ovale wallikeri]|uniref:Uncharacterized protein n=1 Tax=Plasmodium ovale wallikeri TaxID=864142 RepID=A0A1A8YS91_PLAOA|nr:hypothetical protein POVWA1_019870 [Plasmodium ovale wallikeri]SBT34508.1 hypothetical protein POVWA2_020060 [Plasmodium ovale wallikeri]
MLKQSRTAECGFLLRIQTHPATNVKGRKIFPPSFRVSKAVKWECRKVAKNWQRQQHRQNWKISQSSLSHVDKATLMRRKMRSGK